MDQFVGAERKRARLIRWLEPSSSDSPAPFSGPEEFNGCRSSSVHSLRTNGTDDEGCRRSPRFCEHFFDFHLELAFPF